METVKKVTEELLELTNTSTSTISKASLLAQKTNLQTRITSLEEQITAIDTKLGLFDAE